jgi:hypothetical protein
MPKVAEYAKSPLFLAVSQMLTVPSCYSHVKSVMVLTNIMY